VSKLFAIITFTPVENQADTTGLNSYMKYDIPYVQWVILLLYVELGNINIAFRKDKKVYKHPFEGGDQLIEYASTAEYYEAKCDFVLRKKFPKTSRFVNKIIYISSEIMIMMILVLQGMILVF
jgi:hypothetical protein